jgi:hypothetical protein
MIFTEVMLSLSVSGQHKNDVILEEEFFQDDSEQDHPFFSRL